MGFVDWIRREVIYSYTCQESAQQNVAIDDKDGVVAEVVVAEVEMQLARIAPELRELRCQYLASEQGGLAAFCLLFRTRYR